MSTTYGGTMNLRRTLSFCVTLMCVLLFSLCTSEKGGINNPKIDEKADIEGVLLDSNGDPLSLVMVTARPGGQMAVTLSDGSYLLKDMVVGQKNILYFNHPDYNDATLEVTPSKSGKVILDPLKLSYRFGSVSGTVTDFNGAAMAFAGISVEKRTDRTVAMGGSFSLEKIEPGTFKIFAAYPGMGFGSATVTVEAGKSVNNVKLKIDRNGGAVSGVLYKPSGSAAKPGLFKTGETGEPLTGATITALGGIITTTTDSTGRFTLNGVPSDGDVSLTVVSSTGDSMDIAGIRAPENGSIDIGGINIEELITQNGITMVGGIVFANATDSRISLTVRAEASGDTRIAAYQWDINNDGSFDTTTSAPRLEIAAGNAGTRTITVRALTTNPLISAQTRITLVVKDENVAPFFIHGASWMTPAANAGRTYRDTVHAVDLNGDKMTFSLVRWPQGLILSDSIVTWTPTENDLGAHAVAVSVSDSTSTVRDTVAWTIVVREAATSGTDTATSVESVFGVWKLYTQKFTSTVDYQIPKSEVLLEVRKSYLVRWTYIPEEKLLESDTIRINSSEPGFTKVIISDTLIDISYSSESETRSMSARVRNEMLSYLINISAPEQLQIDEYYYPYAGALPPFEWRNQTGSTPGQEITETDGPTISVFYPHSDTVYQQLLKLGISARAPTGIAAVTCAGKALYQVSSDQFTGEIPLVVGINRLPVMARDNIGKIARDTLTIVYAAGSAATDTSFISDTLRIIIVQPSDTFHTMRSVIVADVRSPSPMLEASYAVKELIETDVAGVYIANTALPQFKPMNRSGTNLFSAEHLFSQGLYSISVKAVDLSTGETRTVKKHVVCTGESADTTTKDTTQSQDLLLLAPSHAQRFYTGDFLLVQWSAKNIARITIELVSADGRRLDIASGPVNALSGILSWLIPERSGDFDLANQKLQLVIRNADNETLLSTRDIFIMSRITPPDTTLPPDTSINANRINIISPVNNQTVQIGQPLAIQWFSENTGALLTIVASANDGSSWSVLDTVMALPATYRWTVPSQIGTATVQSRIQLRIVQTSDSKVTSQTITLMVNGGTPPDTTLPPDTIIVPPDTSGPATITITSPRSGSLVKTNDKIDVLWSSSNVVTVNVLLSVDNGTTWSNGASYISASQGYASIAIPATPTGSLLIRVVSTTTSVQSNTVTLAVTS